MAINSIESFNVEGFWDADLGNDALSHVYTTGTIDPLVQQGADTLAAVALVEAENPLQYDTHAALYPTDGPGQWLGQGLREVACVLRSEHRPAHRLRRPRRLGPPRRHGLAGRRDDGGRSPAGCPMPWPRSTRTSARSATRSRW